MATAIDSSSSPLIEAPDPPKPPLPSMKRKKYGLLSKERVLIILNNIKRLGPFALTCHLFGCVGLFYIVDNLLNGENHPHAGPSDSLFFRDGARLPLQFWLIVIGLCISSLLYGLSNLWTQIFDCICSMLAYRGRLDYGRYLNSLPNAPVMNGLRSGLTWLVIAKYIFIGLGIMLSAIYKLFLFTTPGFHEGVIDYHTIDWHLPPFVGEGIFATTIRTQKAVMENWESRQFAGGISPLLLEGWSKGYPYGASKAFVFPTIDLYSPRWYDLEKHPEEGFVLVSIPDCLSNKVFEGNDDGELRSVELVLVARRDRKPLNESSSLLMPGTPWSFSRRTVVTSDRGRGGWSVASSNKSQITFPLILEYSLPSVGRFEMGWTEYFEGWDCGHNSDVKCNNQDQPFLGYAAYNITYGIAHVVRNVQGSSCDLIGYKPFFSIGTDKRLWEDPAGGKGVKLIDVPISPPLGSWLALTNSTTSSSTVLRNLIYLMDTTANQPGSSPLDAIGMLAKFGLLMTANEAAQRPDSAPLGPFNKTTAKRVGYAPNTTNPEEQYYAINFKGTKGSLGEMAACHFWGWVFMLLLALIGIALLPVSILLGPPEMTSWAAQHIHFISQSGRTSLDLGMSDPEDVRDSKRYKKMYSPVKPDKFFISLLDDRKVKYST